MSAQSETDQSKLDKICMNVDLANFRYPLVNTLLIGPNAFDILL